MFGKSGHIVSYSVSPAVRSNGSAPGEIAAGSPDTFQPYHHYQPESYTSRFDYMRYIRIQRPKVWNEILSAGLR